MPISSVDLGPTLLELCRPRHSQPSGWRVLSSAQRCKPGPRYLAGLDTQSHTLLTAMKTPYKLLWDRNRGEISLFDMRVSLPEAEPYDPRPDEKAAQAHAKNSSKPWLKD